MNVILLWRHIVYFLVKQLSDLHN